MLSFLGIMRSSARIFLSIACFALSLWGGTSTLARAEGTSTAPIFSPEVYQAVVLVQCDQRQGSGTVINGNEGYVLTNAHVILNVETGITAKGCIVGFSHVSGTAPDIYYRASIVRSAYSSQRNYDFAVLQITEPVMAQQSIPKPFPFLKTNEFAVVGESVTVIGYSGGENEMRIRAGVITDFQSGFVETTAHISPGDSGGAAVDAHGRLIGIPTRVVTLTTTSDQRQTVTFELVDIRAVMNWMDTYGINEHDRFVGHEDASRYHQNAVFITQTNLGCTDLARTSLSSTVFCILPGRERMTFPNNATYYSWFPDFSTVITVSSKAFTPFSLIRNVTFRPGTLVKSATAPSVYVIVDSFGTMRWIPSEERATAIWGPNWASLVHDIPDEFWVNYTIGQPLDR